MMRLNKLRCPVDKRGRMALGAAARTGALGCALAVVLPVVAFGDPAAPAAAAPDEVVSRFRIGPLFEYRATREGATFWALRPFYSRVSDPVSDTRVDDVVWPIGTFHRLHEQLWWRMALAYGTDLDVNRDDAAWSAALFPIYCQGRTRQGEDYWALFPIYGHVPHMLLMDDIHFVLFPLTLDYRVNGVERDYYLWPIFSHTGNEPGVSRTGVWPLYGETQRKEESHTYCFWPFWTSAVYSGENNPGKSWMLFPLCGSVDREKEHQWMALPPFFSHAVTDSAERWRLPWPFVETVSSKTVQKRSFWPLYGDVGSDDEKRWYAAWPLIESFTLTAGKRRTERSRFFPFYVGETVYERDAAGAERVRETYTRFWPFYARESDDSGSRLRALELSLIRFSGGIERNWAPFWTFYERTEQGHAVTHDALWGLIQVHTAADAGARKEVAP